MPGMGIENKMTWGGTFSVGQAGMRIYQFVKLALPELNLENYIHASNSVCSRKWIDSVKKQCLVRYYEHTQNPSLDYVKGRLIGICLR